jgi:aspartokinase
MVTVSLLVQEHVDGRPLLQEALIEGIVNYANLAERLHPHIEEKLRKKVKHSAIVMALRRHAEKLERLTPKHATVPYDINIKTNLCDIEVQKTPRLVELLKEIDRSIRYDKGDFMNVIHGNYETSVIAPEKYLLEIRKKLSTQKIIAARSGLVAVALTFRGRFYETPGIVARLTRLLAWENINILEIVSTYTELTFIIDKNNLTRAYDVLK